MYFKINVFIYTTVLIIQYIYILQVSENNTLIRQVDITQQPRRILFLAHIFLTNFVHISL